MEENKNQFGSLNNKPRSRKLPSKIDLTAMVSVSFLLIVFFMVTTELSKPKVMNLGLPNYKDSSCIRGCFGGDRSRIITLLLDGNNRIISYKGILDYPEEAPKVISYGKNGIRKELITSSKKNLATTGDSRRGSIVIIKPSKKSSYGNLVDILDEMAITNIDTYAIVNDFSAEEFKLLASR